MAISRARSAARLMGFGGERESREKGGFGDGELEMEDEGEEEEESGAEERVALALHW